MEIGILDSYPELRDEAVRYCALVSRDRSNPRRRTALGGNGMQWLELRSNVCGTVTTVNNFPIKREPSSSLDMVEREEARPKVKEHITWFSFQGEFVVDYPTFLYGRPAQTTIVAMMPSRVIRVTGQQMKQYFDQSKETMELRAIVAEHLLSQFRSRYLDLHCTTPRERYDLLMLTAYYDSQTNTPLLSSSSYPTTTHDFGLSVKFSLTR